jgi:DNA-binding LacI/PurR family transcriptional regulator
MANREKSTSLDIADLAGVSQATVSRALRGSPMVNEKTRERILEIARQLNYTVDKNASNLRTRLTHTLALLFFEDPTADESNINRPVFAPEAGGKAQWSDLLRGGRVAPEGVVLQSLQVLLLGTP